MTGRFGIPTAAHGDAMNSTATERPRPESLRSGSTHRVLAVRDGTRAASLVAVSVLVSLGYIWLWCPLNLAPDEAHYWDWSRHLDWSYYSKGPLVAWIIRGSCELFGSLSIAMTGDLGAAVRSPAVLFHAAFLGGWYVLARDVFHSPRLGLIVVACGAALPLVRVGAVLMTIDPPLMACWCWALICVSRGLERGSRGWWVGAGICAGFGTLAKYPMVLFPAAVVCFLLFHRRSEFRKLGVWLLLAGAALGWVPVILWNMRHDWVSFRHVLGQVGEANAITSGLTGAISFVVGQLGMLFGFWLLAFLSAAWRFRPNRDGNTGVQLLWWVSVPVWCFFAMASLAKPGQPNWPAPAYVGGFVLAMAWARDQLDGLHGRLIRWGMGVSIIGGLMAAAVVHFPYVVRPTIARFAGTPTEMNPFPVRRFDVTARLTGWNDLAAEVDRVRERVKAETGREPVIVGTHWTLPGQLGFYCVGHPDVFSVGIPNISDRHSQYDLWRPNPVSDAQEFRGRSFVIVGDIGPAIIAAFESLETPTRVYAGAGVPVARWTVWVGHGFRGFGVVTPTTPGY
jgi:4-amino-4-deoxy-L-arabinose transferase-like glycosyltransferase